MSSVIGHVVGERYRIVKLLGQGGFGAVYLADHVSLERRFAIKALMQSLESDATFVQRFEREAKLTSGLDHPHIVQVLDFGQDDRVGHYFVMEYMEGEDLSDRIERVKRIGSVEAVRIMRQVVDAFTYAHGKGVIHRDVKSPNIFLVNSESRQDHVKVLDFGIARISEASEEAGNTRLTRTGSVMGSPPYMAPEQALSEETDHRTDIYSLGIVLYEMVTGRLPFTATSVYQILNKQITQVPAAPSEITPEAKVSPHLELIILRCLQKKMDERYQSTAELAEALRGAEARVQRGAEAPAEIISTLSDLRSDMLATGALLSDSSELAQRRLVLGDGYTGIHDEISIATAGRSRASLIAAAVLLLVLTIGTGVWLLGRSDPATQAPPGEAAVATGTASPGGDVTEVEGAGAAPSTAAEPPTPSPTRSPAAAPAPIQVLVASDPTGATAAWKDDPRLKYETPYLIPMTASDDGRVLVLSKDGHLVREVRIELPALKKEKRLVVLLEAAPAPKPAPKATRPRRERAAVKKPSPTKPAPVKKPAKKLPRKGLGKELLD
jgi:eukaryotic-like serine/threonine-protein kinase